MVQQLSVPGLKLTSIAVKWQQMPTTSSVCPAPSYLLLWATKRIDVHRFFMPLLHPWLPVQILVALYILHDCVLCQGLWPCCSPVYWAPVFVLTFTKMYWRIETCTQLRKLLLNFSFSLFPTPCFHPTPANWYIPWQQWRLMSYKGMLWNWRLQQYKFSGMRGIGHTSVMWTSSL